jgi:hypothetical protein
VNRGEIQKILSAANSNSAMLPPSENVNSVNEKTMNESRELLRDNLITP